MMMVSTKKGRGGGGDSRIGYAGNDTSHLSPGDRPRRHGGEDQWRKVSLRRFFTHNRHSVERHSGLAAGMQRHGTCRHVEGNQDSNDRSFRDASRGRMRMARR